MDLTNIKKILQRYDIISNALLFGSYAEKTQHNMSDVDIAVETRGELDLLTIGEIVSELEIATKKKVDFIILNNLYKTAPLLAYNIYKKHTVLFVKEEKNFQKFKENALHYYMDFQYHLALQNKAFHQRIEDGNLAKTQTA